MMIPHHIAEVLGKLTFYGYEAYIVGGAVRDMVLGRTVHDYDITTSAKPEEVIDIATKEGWAVSRKPGKQFGVVLLLLQDGKAEVATFRGESYGEDGHRPDKVWYAETLTEDLARRDFTMNAMALTLEGEILDPFNGRRDIAAGYIVAVGSPTRRFAEDALRMFRACRFAAELGFALKSDLFPAISTNVSRVTQLSLDRVRTELDRLLLGGYCPMGLQALLQSGLYQAVCRTKVRGMYQTVPILPELGHLWSMPQNPLYHKYDVWEHTLAAVERVLADLTLRWAALLHDIGKGLPGVRSLNKAGQPTDHGHDKKGADIARDILSRLKLPVKLQKRVTWLVANHMKFHYYAHTPQANVAGWLRAEARSKEFKQGSELVDAFHQLVLLCLADVEATGLSNEIKNTAAEFGKVLVSMAKDMPVATRDLRYEADRLLLALGNGEQFAAFIKTALTRVQDGTLINQPDALAAAATKWAQRQHTR